jgi:enoyl-CoA hydratase/carnithine racemase
VRIGRILGPDRMIEMMLTGRRYGAAEGLALGLCHYGVGAGEAMALAEDLAGKIADNASLSNYVMIQAISRIGDMAKADGLFTESLCAALTQTSRDAEEGLRAFLEKRQPSFS